MAPSAADFIQRLRKGQTFLTDRVPPAHIRGLALAILEQFETDRPVVFVILRNV